MTSFSRDRFAVAFILFLPSLLAGCAGYLPNREGKALIAEGKIQEGLTKLEEATRDAPDKLDYRVDFLNTRDAQIGKHLSAAQQHRSAGRLDEAEVLYKRVLDIDRTNANAHSGLVAIEQGRRHLKWLTDASSLFMAGDMESADMKLAAILGEAPQHTEARQLRRQIEEKLNRYQVVPPTLRQTFRKTVTLEFRDTNLKQVIEALSRHSGLNFILDKDVPGNLAITVYLRQVSVEDALEVILSTHQLERRVLNDTTLLIYPNTAAKQGEHQDLVVKSFYLTNAPAKQVMEMLKTVIKAKSLYVDEKLNLLIMRDTPNAIRLAERLVALQDVAEPEVMLEVEVVEVQRSRMMQLGIQFPDQLTLAPLATGTTLTLANLQNLSSSRVGATISNTVINLHRDVGETNILANPRIRTRNREKAEIRIGDRVPVITTTSTSTGFVSESVQYVDVGLKLNVEPTIYPDNEVSIKLSLEVSSVVKEVVSKAGSLSYQIGGRNASTVLRLKDGETQILGGLINDQDRMTANRVPGLGDLPVLGRLFSSQKNDGAKTELVLSITPRLVRGIAPPQNMPTEFWSGSENNLRLKPLAVQPASPSRTLPTSTSLPPSQATDQPSPVLKAADLPPSPDNLAGNPSKPALLGWDGPAQARVGQVIKLSVRASGNGAVSSFPLQLKFDPAVVELVDASAGALMLQPGGKVSFSKRIVPGSGMAFFTQTREGDPAKGDGEVLSLQVKALKAAPSSLLTILPATPLGVNNLPLPTTGPAMIGLSIAP